MRLGLEKMRQLARRLGRGGRVMSGSTDHPPRSDDAAAYVLGALDGHEASEFRAHIASCVRVCAEEVDRLAAAAALLPLARAADRGAGRVATPRARAGGARARAVPRRRAGGRRLFGRFELSAAGALAVGLADRRAVARAGNAGHDRDPRPSRSATRWSTSRTPAGLARPRGQQAPSSSSTICRRRRAARSTRSGSSAGARRSRPKRCSSRRARARRGGRAGRACTARARSSSPRSGAAARRCRRWRR